MAGRSPGGIGVCSFSIVCFILLDHRHRKRQGQAAFILKVKLHLLSLLYCFCYGFCIVSVTEKLAVGFVLF